MLAVVEGQLGELVRVRVRDVRRDQVAVKAGAGVSDPAPPTGRAAGRRRRLCMLARSGRPRGERVDELGPAGRGRLRIRRGEQRRPSRGSTRVAGVDGQLRAADGALLDDQSLGLGAHEQLAAVADDAFARQEEVRHVGEASAPVAEHRDGLGDVDVQRADEVERVGVPVDDAVGEARIRVRVDLPHDLDGRRGPDEAGVGGRSADGRALLDEDDRRSVLHRPRRGAQPGHAAAENEEVDLHPAVCSAVACSTSPPGPSCP